MVRRQAARRRGAPRQRPSIFLCGAAAAATSFLVTLTLCTSARGAAELASNNESGAVAQGSVVVEWCYDRDSDGYGDPERRWREDEDGGGEDDGREDAVHTTALTFLKSDNDTAPLMGGYVANCRDCDDSDPDIYPFSGKARIRRSNVGEVYEKWYCVNDGVWLQPTPGGVVA